LEEDLDKVPKMDGPWLPLVGPN